MGTHQKSLLSMAAVFLILIAVNLFRVGCRTLFPDSLFGLFLVYFTYILLLFLWCRSLKQRITQKSICRMLILSAAIMAFWMGVRFLQEAILQDRIYALRMTGYLIHIPIIWIPLLGFFASCHLGRGDTYHMNRGWYWLILVALLLTVMAFTDPVHHYVYYVPKDEPQPNIYFHPNIGLLIITGWALALEPARVCMIYRRNRLLESKSRIRRLVPFVEIILMFIFMIPYFIHSFYVENELIEFSAGIAFLESLSWEICIYVGLIPTNTQYETVFYRSTLGMQLIDHNGAIIARAGNSIPITPEMFTQLKEAGKILAPDGQEICMQPNRAGYTIWQRNVSDLYGIIYRLSQIESELREQSNLLSHELRAKSEKTALHEQNRIYNQLTEETSDQIAMLNNLLRKKKLCSENEAILQKICLIGTYIKQRCNLRLIEQAEHQIRRSDLEHSFRDLAASLSDYGIRTDIKWYCSWTASALFSLTAYDIFWYGLEYKDFQAEAAIGIFEAPDCFTMELILKEGETHFPMEALRTHCLPDIQMNGEQIDRTIRVRIRERAV